MGRKKTFVPLSVLAKNPRAYNGKEILVVGDRWRFVRYHLDDDEDTLTVDFTLSLTEAKGESKVVLKRIYSNVTLNDLDFVLSFCTRVYEERPGLQFQGKWICEGKGGYLLFN